MKCKWTNYFFVGELRLLGGGEGDEASLRPGGGDWAPDISSECFLLMGYDPGNQPPGVWLSVIIVSLQNSRLYAESLIISLYLGPLIPSLSGLPGRPGRGTPIVAPCFWSCSRVRVRLLTWIKVLIFHFIKQIGHLCSVHLRKLLEMMIFFTFFIKSKLHLSDVSPESVELRILTQISEALL